MPSAQIPQGAALDVGVDEELDLVLLIGAVALVEASGGRKSESLRGRAHGRQYKL
jgi:hypothetical protein